MEAIPEETSKVHLHSSTSGLKKEANEFLNQMNLSHQQDWENNFSNKTVLCQYVNDLITSGKSENEVIDGIEAYYHTLVSNCDNEIVDLKEELEFQRAAFREESADEVYMKSSELDELSNIFIDCIFAERKTLRQQLVKMKFKEEEQDNDDTQFD